MPDRFYESDTENAPEYECLHRELYRIQEQSVSDLCGTLYIGDPVGGGAGAAFAPCVISLFEDQ